MDPAGFKREMFIIRGRGGGGEMLTQSLLAMSSSIKDKASTPLQWNKTYIQTLKKKNGSVRKLSNYRDIFLVSIICIMFEKSLQRKIVTKQSYTIIGRKYAQVSDRMLKTRELWITFLY